MKEKTADGKKNIKKQRIRKYFLEAAKDIIIREGVENVSVRKVADIAGYSYATIYNYFSDLNELLWDVKGLMFYDVAEYIGKRIPQPTYDKEGIKKLFVTYVDYYLENSNVFKFFYLYPINQPDKKVENIIDQPDFNQMWRDAFKVIIQEGKIMEKDIEVLSKIFIYSMYGILTLNFTRNWSMTEENVHSDLEQIIDYLL